MKTTKTPERPLATTIRLYKKQKTTLGRLSKKLKISESEVIRKAIEFYAERLAAEEITA